MITDYLIRRPLDRESLERIAVPESLHRWMASFLPNLQGRSQAIRADTQTQFRVDLPTEPLGETGQIVLRMRTDALGHPAGEAASVPPLLEPTEVLVRLAAQRRKTLESGKVSFRDVADDTVHGWVTALLGRHGLATTAEQNLHISPVRSFGQRGSVRFTTRDIRAIVTPADPDLAGRALRHGIGRGRAYGLGMVVPVSLSSSIPHIATRKDQP